jgi:hypothetical protein
VVDKNIAVSLVPNPVLNNNQEAKMAEKSQPSKEDVAAIRDALIETMKSVDMEALRSQAAARLAQEEPVIICVSGCG